MGLAIRLGTEVIFVGMIFGGLREWDSPTENQLEGMAIILTGFIGLGLFDIALSLATIR